MSPMNGGQARGLEGNANIRVAVRIRPVLSEEAQRGQESTKINVQQDTIQ